VRALASAMRNVGATGGVCITTGNFTKPAREFAISMAIELVDGQALIRRFSKGIRKAA
jgi:restriction endonuclease Mrr